MNNTPAKQDLAGLYLRISQDSEKQGKGVERQRQACMETIQRERWALVDTYTDNDKSATDGTERTNYLRLLRDVRMGKVNRIVAFARDRLSRNTHDAADLEDLAKECGVLITIHPNTTYDLREPADMLSFQVLGSVGNFESGQKNKRQRARLDADFQEGYPFARRRTFGWKVNEAKAGLRNQNPYDLTIIEPEEAEAVRWAFNEVIEGRTKPRYIAEEFNRRGLYTTGGNPWTMVGVSDLLKNPYYAGIQCRHKVTVDSKGKKHYATNQWETFPDIETKWTPIVSRDVFNRVQGILQHKTAKFLNGKQRPTRKPYWLAGVIKCSVCGRYLHRNGEFYECSSDWHHNRIKKEIAEPIIIDYLVGTIAIEGVRLRMSDPSTQRAKELTDLQEELEADLVEAKKIKSMAIKVEEMNRITDQLASIDEERLRLQSTHTLTSVIANLIPLGENGRVKFENAAENREKVREGWEKLDIAQRQQIAQSMGEYYLSKRAPGVFGAKRLSIHKKDLQTGEVEHHSTDEDPIGLLD